MKVVNENPTDIITYEDLYNSIEDILIFGIDKEDTIWCVNIVDTDSVISCTEIGGDTIFYMTKSDKSFDQLKEFLDDQKEAYVYETYEEYHTKLLNFICDVWKG